MWSPILERFGYREAVLFSFHHCPCVPPNGLNIAAGAPCRHHIHGQAESRQIMIVPLCSGRSDPFFLNGSPILPAKTA
jgi:hypothetical protein